MLNGKNQLSEQDLDKINGGAKSCDRHYSITCPVCGGTIKTNRLSEYMEITCSGCNRKFHMGKSSSNSVVIYDDNDQEYNCAMNVTI